MPPAGAVAARAACRPCCLAAVPSPSPHGTAHCPLVCRSASTCVRPAPPIGGSARLGVPPYAPVGCFARSGPLPPALPVGPSGCATMCAPGRSAWPRRLSVRRGRCGGVSALVVCNRRGVLVDRRFPFMQSGPSRCPALYFSSWLPAGARCHPGHFPRLPKSPKCAQAYAF